MTRLERNRLKRQRTRRKLYFVSGILICIFILGGGIYITNDIMVKMTSLPKEENIFYAGNIETELEEILSMLRHSSEWLEAKFVQFYYHIAQWVERFK